MNYSRGKLTKHNVLAKHSELVTSLPTTYSMSEKNLFSLLGRYNEVIVKPSHGSGGAGVISVSSCGSDKYIVQYEKTKKTISGRSSLYAFIKGQTQGKKHIIQRKITLAEVNGNPFDVRVMVQRKQASAWAVTGKLAKIAGKGYIVTNVARSKGKVVPLETAIRDSNIRGPSVSQMVKVIDQTALEAAKLLQKHYGIRTVGLDIGLDSKGKAWIIEANFTPSKALFLKLKDKSMYNRIVGYGGK